LVEDKEKKKMAVHGLTADVTLGGTAIEGYLETTEMNLQRELAELRHLGGTAVGRLAGLRNCTFTGEGDYDETSLAAALWNTWNSDTSTTVTFKPGGSNTYSFSAFIESYTIRAAANAAVRFTLNLASDGAISKS